MHEREVVSDMAVFVAIVEAGSLAAAAKRTGLTPSAVSKLLARLEQRFGAPLLRRTTRRMTVTDAGQMFYERALRILEDLRNVEQEMSHKNAEPRGLVRVSTSLTWGQVQVVPLLLSFLKKAPTISMDLVVTNRIVDLVAERIDVAVRLTADPPLSFVARRVGSVQRLLCASPAYLRGVSAPRTPADLVKHACLLRGSPDAPESWSLRSKAEGAKTESVRCPGRLYASDLLSLREAALAGLGIAELPRYLVAEDLKARRLSRVLEPYESSSRDVYIVYAAGRLLPGRVRALVDHLVPGLEAILREGV